MANQALSPSRLLLARLCHHAGLVSSEQWSLSLIHTEVSPAPKLCLGAAPSGEGASSNCCGLPVSLQWPRSWPCVRFEHFACVVLPQPVSLLGSSHQRGQPEQGWHGR